MLQAIAEEMGERKGYLKGEQLETIYFGGGTPSLLEKEEIGFLLDSASRRFSIHPDAEITLEANPDDLSREKILALKEAGINRLSIGIQSFHDSDLSYLNRAHTAAQALQCIRDAQSIGITNITIDFIYGIPDQTDEAWLENLDLLKSLDLPHFSAYALTVEPKTALASMINKGTSTPVDEEQTARHFNLLLEWAAQNGYEQYEISNFSKPGFRARHNTSYWQGKSYLGLGPSAHSFDGKTRRWNAANNAMYIRGLQDGTVYFETEELTPSDKYNEYMMTRLRTSWGASLEEIENLFAQSAYCIKQAKPYISEGLLLEEKGSLILSQRGKLLADKIIADLFYID
jgi:oxygen-independent coproporphyrinogen-3 oxidase